MNETERVTQALASIPSIKTVTRGWPKQDAALPCVAVTLAGERGAEFRDDSEYLTELEYYVRCFTRTAGETDAVGREIRACMESLGYLRVFAWESADEKGILRTERYTIVL
ncbi:MAG: hypothetical protein PHI98_14950 [Eubacteriales bacterium]|nr:hypothetical protein [Eubacteriales bacterium]